MAIIDNSQDNSIQSDKDSTNVTGGPVNIAGTAAPSNTGKPSGSSAAPTLNSAAPTPTTSGQWTNLQNYISANQGFNADNGGLSGQMYNDMNKQANTIQNNYSKDSDQFTNSYNNGLNTYDPTLASNVLANPTGASATDQSAFTKMLTGGYTGPTTNSQDYSNLQNDYNAAKNYQSNANNASTDAGRYALLSNLYGNQNYNQGQQSLDNVLLQGGNNQQFNQLPGQSNNLVNNIQTGMTANAGMIPQAQQRALGTNISTGNALTDALNSLNGNVATQATGNTNTANTNFQNLLTGLQGGVISQDNNKLFNLSGQQAYGIDPSKYFSGPLAATNQNSITPEQLASLKALGSLAGSTGIGSNILSSYTNATPGAYSATPTFDSNGFTTAVGKAQGDFNSAFQSLPTYITGGSHNVGGSSATTLGPYQLGAGIIGSGNPLQDLANLQNDANIPDHNTSADQQAIAALQSLLSQYGGGPADVIGTVGNQPITNPFGKGHGPAIR